MPIESNNPLVINQETKIYDRWWMWSTRTRTINIGLATQSVELIVEYRRYRLLEDGTYDFAPLTLPGARKLSTLSDVYFIAFNNPDFLNALTAYVTAVPAVSRAQGDID